MTRLTAFFCLLFTCLCALAAAPRVFFVNVYAGDEIYELEGHSALVVEEDGKTTAFNYGIFDFNSPNFVYRFVKGETDYMVAAYPFAYFLQSYRSEGRRVVAHELDLDSAQTRRLIDSLYSNIRPENRVYRYNYVKDNCATRPLAMIERVLPDSIALAPAPFEAQPLLQPTFRNVMRHYHRNYPWYQFGIDIALGAGIDTPIVRHAMAFAPVELDAMLAGATVAGKPLVKDSMVLVDLPPEAAVEAPTPWLLTPMAAAWLLLVAAIAVTAYDIARKRRSRGFDAALFGAIGLTGCLLTFLIFVSVHEATSPNYLYPWLNPLCLLVPALLWVRKGATALRIFMAIYTAVLVILAVAWPFLPQSANAAFLPLYAATLLRSAFGAFKPGAPTKRLS